MTWLAVQALSKQYLHVTLWHILRHIRNPTQTSFLQIFTKRTIPDAWQGLEYASVVSLDWFATTCHSCRLLHAVSLGQIRISLDIAIAFKRFAQRSEKDSSASLKRFSKLKVSKKVLILICFWKIMWARLPRNFIPDNAD